MFNQNHQVTFGRGLRVRVFRHVYQAANLCLTVRGEGEILHVAASLSAEVGTTLYGIALQILMEI